MHAYEFVEDLYFMTVWAIIIILPTIDSFKF